MITHKGKKIDYIEHGEGPAILFIPGSFSTPSAWSAVQKLMPPNYRFISTSLCGYGSTEELRSTDNYGMQNLINVIEAVVPKMQARGRGAIVNVGAMSAREGQANMGAYISAKSTIMRLTESMAKELKHEGINVNAVLPNIIDTPANRAGMPDQDFKSWVSPESLANVMCFLASDSAAAVHGALVPVSGLS